MSEPPGGYGASAYYLDEQAEDCLVEFDGGRVRFAPDRVSVLPGLWYHGLVSSGKGYKDQ